MITGLGAITAAGPSVAHLRQALRREKTYIAPLRLLDVTGLKVGIAGEVGTIPDSSLLPRTWRVRASRSDRLVLVAAEEALGSSGLTPRSLAPERVAVAIGSSTGGMLETESFYKATRRGQHPARFRPQLLSATVAAPTALVASAVGAAGRRLSPSTACSSSAIALAIGLAWIRSGAADVVIAGGGDGLARMTFSGFLALQAMSPAPCQPFDRHRRGMSIGEGAAVLILESEEHARRRCAPVLAELAGAAFSCDASHLTAPEPDGRGAAQALAGALADAQVAPHEIDYVNAHGTGTPQNDLAEARALQRVLGEATPRVPVSSTKGLIGHLLGAAGAVEAVISVLAVCDAFVPANFNSVEIDPACPLDIVGPGGRAREVRVVVSNSYGFGGNNCSLVIRRP